MQHTRYFHEFPVKHTDIAPTFGDLSYTHFIRFSHTPPPIFGYNDEALASLHKRQPFLSQTKTESDAIIGYGCGQENARIAGEIPKTRAKRSFHSEARKIYDNAANESSGIFGIRGS